MRTQQEITERIAQIKDDDFFGFRVEVLVCALDFEHAQPHLKPEVTPAEWMATAHSTDQITRAQAADYLEFAWGKAADHRGISANRSVEKLAEYAWLLGRDDVVAAMDGAKYAQYGVPKLVAFAEGMGLPVRTDDGLDRMALGLECWPECAEGCAR